jgi:hypothetical protein
LKIKDKESLKITREKQATFRGAATSYTADFLVETMEARG